MGDSPEDVVGRGEVKAAPVGFLHIAHAHVNERDANAQVVLLVGRWGGEEGKASGQSGEGRVWDLRDQNAEKEEGRLGIQASSVAGLRAMSNRVEEGAMVTPSGLD